MPEQIPTRGFESVEYQRRCTALQEQMAGADLHAVLFCSEAELRYFTGYATQFWQSPTRPWFVLIPATGRPVAVIPSIGEALMATCYVGDILTWPAPQPGDEGISLLADTITKLAGSQARLGLMMGHETSLRMPLADWHKLNRILTPHWHDITAMVQRLRQIKSAAEIRKISHVCQIVSEVFAAMPDWLAEGMAEDEVFRRFKIAALEAGVDDVNYLVGGAGQGGYGDIISAPTQRPLQAGDVLMLDTGCVFDGYFSDFDRNFAMGSVSDQVHEVYDVLWRATEAGFSAATPGRRTAELFATMDQVIIDAGYGVQGGAVGRYGHGLGLQLTETPSQAAWDNTLLAANMVLTLEPSLSYGDGKIMVHEENILLTADGPKWLSQRARPQLPQVS